MWYFSTPGYAAGNHAANGTGKIHLICRMNKGTGLYLLIIGGVIVLAGALIYFFHDKLGWIGRLPGDIRIERKNFSLYIPITTMLVFSVLFSLVMYLLRKIL